MGKAKKHPNTPNAETVAAMKELEAWRQEEDESDKAPHGQPPAGTKVYYVTANGPYRDVWESEFNGSYWTNKIISEKNMVVEARSLAHRLTIQEELRTREA